MAKDAREELLLRMYDQMFNDINRHITVVWQTIGVLVGAFAVFALAEKNIVSVDIASALIMLIAGWSWAHHIDAAYWYNRNLAIIANIERLFLAPDDLQKVHYYFGQHRSSNKMIKHLRIQVALSIGVGSIVLAFHFHDRVWPGIGAPLSSLEALRTLPYVSLVAVFVYVLPLRRNRDEAYSEFLKNSPGIVVRTSGVSYGRGHAYSKKSS